MLATASFLGRRVSAGTAEDLLVPAVQKLSVFSQGDGADSGGSGGGGAAAEKNPEVAMVS